MSINISVDVDILITEESINLYRQKSKFFGLLSDDQIREIMLLGTCGETLSLDCDKAVDILYQVHQQKKNPGADSPLARMADEIRNVEFDSLTPEEQSQEKCETLKELQESGATKLDYYLAYVFDQDEGSINSIGDSNEISGKIILTPFEPKSGSGKYGGAEPPTAFPCDPCEQTFKKLQYNDEEEIKNLLKNTDLIQVSHDWRTNGFDERNPPLGYDGKPITMPRTVNYKDGFGRPRSEKRIEIILDKYLIGDSKFNNVALISKYDGFNKWLYTKYYGGQNYSLIKQLGVDGEKVGINLGKVLTLEAKIVRHPELDINIVSITITKGILDMYLKRPQGLALEVLSNTSGLKLPKYLDVKKIKKYIDLLRNGQLKLSTEIYAIPEEVVEEVVVDCCPYAGIETYNIELKKTVKGRKFNLDVSVDTIQRAQGGIYNKDIDIPSKDNPDGINPCCEECNYCIFGTLCPGLEGILQAIRDAEIQMRDHDANPYIQQAWKTDYDGSLDDYPEFKTARSPGPQCIAFDFYSGWPVPLGDIKGY